MDECRAGVGHPSELCDHGVVMQQLALCSVCGVAGARAGVAGPRDLRGARVQEEDLG